MCIRDRFIPSSITKENIDIIIKMREDNIPVEKIAYYTGIPKEIIGFFIPLYVSQGFPNSSHITKCTIFPSSNDK